jgi:hypothetical protein
MPEVGLIRGQVFSESQMRLAIDRAIWICSVCDKSLEGRCGASNRLGAELL